MRKTVASVGFAFAVPISSTRDHSKTTSKHLVRATLLFLHHMMGLRYLRILLLPYMSEISPSTSKNKSKIKYYATSFYTTL